MIYYIEDSKPRTFIPMTDPIGQGEQGYVYKYDENKCIKIYIDGMPTIKPEIFKLYKELSLEGYSKLHELWYRDPNLQEIGAYLSDFYNNDANNILFMPVEYTTDNLNMLYNSIKTLSEHGILVRDLIPKNVILGSAKITVVDYDSSKITSKPAEELTRINICSLLTLFKKLYKESLREIAINIDNNKGLNNYIDYLFTNKEEPTKKLQRKMPKGRPIDYLYERC